MGVGEQVVVEEDTHLQTHAEYSMGRSSGLAILNLRAIVRMYWKGCIMDVGSTAPPHTSRCFSANLKEEGGVEGCFPLRKRANMMEMPLHHIDKYSLIRASTSLLTPDMRMAIMRRGVFTRLVEFPKSELATKSKM